MHVAYGLAMVDVLRECAEACDAGRPKAWDCVGAE